MTDSIFQANSAFVPKQRRAQAIADHLKDLILSGQVGKGVKLPTEESLCQYYQVSRTTLREAIQMLRVAGVLAVSPGRGSYVRVPELPEVSSNLAMYLKMLDLVDYDALRMLGACYAHSMPYIAKQPIGLRKELFDHILNPNQTPVQAAQTEAAWLGMLAKLADSKILAIFNQSILNALQVKRQERFADKDEVMRAIQLQFRLNATLSEGDDASAMRVLNSYLNGLLVPEEAKNTKAA